MIYFAQHKPDTQYLGYRCDIHDTPHYKYLQGDLQAYVTYLIRSWGYEYGSEMALQYVMKFDHLIEDIRNNGHLHPILVTRGADDCELIIDGNHRTAICEFYGIELHKTQVNVIDHLEAITRIQSERYGSASGKPYQSIYDGSKLLVEGRRPDLLERQEKIGDLYGLSVIDFGCNLGSACLLACDFGATRATGVESVYDICVGACRVNAVMNRPVQYHCADLSQHHLFGKHDIGFMFSIDLHVKNNVALAQNIRTNVSKAVYFECHTGAKIPDEIRAVFSQIDHIGTNYDNREFYKCWINY